MRIGEQVRLKLTDGKTINGEIKETFPREGFCLVSHEAGPWVGVPARDVSRARRWGQWLLIGVLVVALLAGIGWLAANMMAEGWRMDTLEFRQERVDGCMATRGPIETECA